MSPYAGCTIIARNYQAQASVLAESFGAAHEGVPFYTLVVDGLDTDSEVLGCGIVLHLSDLGTQDETLTEMLAIYDVMEFATAVKPLLLAALLRRGHEAVAYLDPDIRVFSSISDVFEDAAESGIVLTPHTVDPFPRDGKQVDEHSIMLAGIFNLGFIAVGRAAGPFLSWWAERLAQDAIVDVADGLFTDQRWIDWVPALFPHVIRRDRGLNVAYWNLHERPLSVTNGVLSAGADTVRFIHFSGYRPTAPWMLSVHQGSSPRILLSEHPLLRELCDQYAEALFAHGHAEHVDVPYRFDVLSTGVRLNRVLRRFIRDQRRSPQRGLEPVPDPFRMPVAFTKWLTSRSFGRPEPAISPLELALWSLRPDLRAAFPRVDEGITTSFRGWLDASDEAAAFSSEVLGPVGALARGSATERSEAGSRHSSSRVRHPFGWSVVGYARAELGVGEAGRRLHSIVQRSGVPCDLVGVGVDQSREWHPERVPIETTPGYENALVAVNADQLRSVGPTIGLEQMRGRKVGYWFWELEYFPPRFAQMSRSVHEVWVATTFMQRAIQATTDTPVRVVPLPITVHAKPTSFTRPQLGMPQDPYVFIVSFDYLSSFQRKNPIGAIRAFRSAFSPGDGAVLMVKSINGHRLPGHAERVRAEARGRDDILLLDDYVSASRMQAMIELADCYVSLHRSEGLGLNMADAMARSTPVIATGYSGNLDFMSEDTASLIPFELVEVDSEGIYPAEGWWAEPDVEAAASAMRALFDDRQRGVDLAARALERIATDFSPDVCTSVIEPLLLERA